MPNQSYPYLCGGVFLTYLMGARKPRAGVREHYNGETDGLSDPELLEDLIKVICPTLINPPASTFKQNTSAYKNCTKSSGTYLPFVKDSAEVRSFDDCVHNNYTTALSRMVAFTDKYLEIGTETKKDEYLIKALVEVIKNDAEILTDAEFYIDENGTASTKDEIIHAEVLCFQSFLVGVWHYILLHRPDNTLGRNTIDNWKPTYSAEYLKRISYASSVEPPGTESIEAEPVIEDTDSEEELHESKAQTGTTQTVNNPVVFNQYGSNGTQIGSVGTLIIKHDK